MLSKSEVLTHFNPFLPTQPVTPLLVEWGRSCYQTENKKPAAFVSKTAETHFTQLEQAALSMLFGVWDIQKGIW